MDGYAHTCCADLVEERTGMAVSRDGSGRVHVGTNEAARQDALKRVPAWFEQ